MKTNPRELITQALIADQYIDDDVDDRVYQYNSVPDPVMKPYIVVKFGVESAEPGWRAGPTQRPIQVWVHDDPGDFSRIDRVLQRTKTVLQSLPNKDEFLELRFVDTSRDLDDTALGVITKYSTYQMTATV